MNEPNKALHAEEQYLIAFDKLIHVAESLLVSLKQVRRREIVDQVPLLIELAEMLQEIAADVDRAGLLADKLVKLPKLP